VAERIAVLGWGSLLWEGRREFDPWHGPWLYDGPLLRLEFSRVSSSRSGALTLAIDPENGVPTMVAYCFSRRSNILEAIEDLRARESASAQGIGSLRIAGEASCRDRESREAILDWATERQIDEVLWTDLRSNFVEKTGRRFSVPTAVAYLDSLGPEERAKALEYLRRAPSFVRTPLREAVQT